ncbi:glycosyltransferase family 2 protein [Rhodoligotrophos ferricapiens]|uniref:glycosyltransferase family 2 protein n=1 Tax=Rhodoligotrophos ferricapiens TaxID=3069264 RepID=UPI00315DCCCE
MIISHVVSEWRDQLAASLNDMRAFNKRMKRRFRNSAGGTALRVASRRLAIRRAAAELSPIRTLPAIAADAVTVVACMRDEALRLPDFLRHYRGLGAARFILIDNGSKDASRDIALEAADVELLRADGSYAGSMFGMDWVMAAIGRSGFGRWYVVADIDELLVYDGCEQHTLAELANWLRSHGRLALPAMMLDMYGPLPIAKTHLLPGASMIDACPFFDTDYSADETEGQSPDARQRFIYYRGGPRLRTFSTPDRPFQGKLAKTPFMRWDANALYLDPHIAFPYERNFLPTRGCLLHFKFIEDFHQRALAAIDHGEHWNGSLEYRRYREVIEQDPELTLFHHGSGRYRGSRSLVDAGLMPAVAWDARSTG